MNRRDVYEFFVEPYRSFTKPETYLAVACFVLPMWPGMWLMEWSILLGMLVIMGGLLFPLFGLGHVLEWWNERRKGRGRSFRDMLFGKSAQGHMVMVMLIMPAIYTMTWLPAMAQSWLEPLGVSPLLGLIVGAFGALGVFFAATTVYMFATRWNRRRRRTV